MALASINGLDNAMGSQKSAIAPGNEVGNLRSEFLQMMVAQINNQDPLNPLDGTQYVTQLAQFSMVEGIEQMKLQGQQQATLLDTLQVLGSTSLMGKKVTVPVQSISLSDAESLSGTLPVPAGTEQLTLEVYDQQGQRVHQQEWTSPTGDQTFALAELPAGEYEFRVTATRDGESLSLSPYMERTVEKVSLPAGGGDIMLGLAGVGQMSLFQVTEFGQS
ncbi:flagellar hook capping FlgD N-terminal domain-containing protein [Oceanimonas sp. CHS3-5]|uniref:flagellar hook assembly protein FlgD n=1 Tax=Oceanimonas sp. CHS3-5 TaxID=3068186 RepID=UPI00273F35FD|nr:flagellar hook capping FlgD N-terminal domain-containing protein [Oceanimonas sp. CHS3-5]MDP5292389.1 flagellar hook capping FlgD N-terminal domain-containing protein [Oceanimonas sp. CHS3-5]